MKKGYGTGKVLPVKEVGALGFDAGANTGQLSMVPKLAVLFENFRITFKHGYAEGSR